MVSDVKVHDFEVRLPLHTDDCCPSSVCVCASVRASECVNETNYACTCYVRVDICGCRFNWRVFVRVFSSHQQKSFAHPLSYAPNPIVKL